MADFVLKYADGRGQIHHQVASAASEKELREKYAQQGFLIYSLKARSGGALTVRLRLKSSRVSVALPAALLFFPKSQPNITGTPAASRPMRGWRSGSPCPRTAA